MEIFQKRNSKHAIIIPLKELQNRKFFKQDNQSIATQNSQNQDPQKKIKKTYSLSFKAKVLLILTKSKGLNMKKAFFRWHVRSKRKLLTQTVNQMIMNCHITPQIAFYRMFILKKSEDLAKKQNKQIKMQKLYRLIANKYKKQGFYRIKNNSVQIEEKIHYKCDVSLKLFEVILRTQVIQKIKRLSLSKIKDFAQTRNQQKKLDLQIITLQRYYQLLEIKQTQSNQLKQIKNQTKKSESKSNSILNSNSNMTSNSSLNSEKSIEQWQQMNYYSLICVLESIFKKRFFEIFKILGNE